MLARRFLRLARLAAAAAAILAAAPGTHHPAAMAAARPGHATAQICPAGTNWNDILHTCI